MASIAAGVSSTNDTVVLTIPETQGRSIRIHSISGGFIPAPAGGAERNLALTFDQTTVGRWPVFTVTHIPFPVEVHAPDGDGGGAGDVIVQLGAGGAGVTGYVSITYTLV